MARDAMGSGTGYATSPTGGHVRLLPVGGFIASGKTTLLWEAARLLDLRHRRVALVAGDRGAYAVDTLFLKTTGHAVREIRGLCQDDVPYALEAVCDDLACCLGEGAILVETMGVCVDLRPTLQEMMATRCPPHVVCSPITVVVDPQHLVMALETDDEMSDTGGAFIGEQLEQAGFIFLNKADLLHDSEASSLVAAARGRWPRATILTGSARDGAGVSAWLDRVSASEIRLPEDGCLRTGGEYELTTHGLAWLNRGFIFDRPVDDPLGLVTNLLYGLYRRLRPGQTPAAHIKILLEADGSTVAGNCSGGQDPLSVRRLERLGMDEVLLVNVRLKMRSEILEDIVREEVERVFRGYGVHEDASSRLASSVL